MKSDDEGRIQEIRIKKEKLILMNSIGNTGVIGCCIQGAAIESIDPVKAENKLKKKKKRSDWFRRKPKDRMSKNSNCSTNIFCAAKKEESNTAALYIYII